jgi:TRAP-type C4-dicarboxylate transport system substrate-binding protein
MWRALGASPKALAITDLPAAVEAGQIEAFDIQSAFMFAASLHSQVHHYTLSNHIYQPAPLVANRTAMSPATMKLVMEAWSRSERTCIEGIRAENRLVDAELPKAGIQVTQLTPEARSAFETQLAPLRQRFRKTTTPAGRALLDAVEKVLARHRGRQAG